MCKKLIVFVVSLCLISSVGAATVSWDFENGNGHNFDLWSVIPPGVTIQDDAVAGDEELTGVGGSAGLPDAGVAWTVGPPDQFDGLIPAVAEGCHVMLATGLLQYGPCNDPFGYTGQTPNSRGQTGYLNTYNLSQWGDDLHSAANDQIATSPVVTLGEGAVLTVWSHGGGSDTHAPEYDADPAMMYTDGSSGIVVWSADEADMYAILATIHTNGKSTLTEDSVDLSAFAGKQVQIDVVDAFQGGWGWLAIDEIQITNAVSKNAVLVVANDDLSMGFDQAEHDRLVQLGYAVTVVESGEINNGSFTIDNCNGFDLLIVSESIMSYEADNIIGTTTPIMHNESHGWDNWFFTAAGAGGWQAGINVDIVNDAHPIIVDAGISLGEMQFFDPQGEWTSELVSEIAPGAEILASVHINDNDYLIIFAIEEGAELANGTPAIARAVGFSLPGQGYMAPEVMTDEGWAIWDAAIAWLDPAPVEIPDAVAHWPLDEGSGDVVADASGNGHDGIILGDVNDCWVEGVTGTALQFGTAGCDGVDCNMWNPSADSNELSVACWTKFSTGGATYQGILANRTGYDHATNHWALECNGGNGEFYFGSRNGSAYGLGTMPEGEWALLAITFDGENLVAYLDAEEVNSSTSAKFGDDKNSTTRIGASEAGGNIFEGAIDDVRIYNVVLSKEQIGAIY